jgi:hypothetical protein
MASTISAGTTTTTALVYSADTSGVLQLQTNGGTTAVTLDNSQNVGVGVTPSAWNTSIRAIEMPNGRNGALYADSGYYGAFGLVNNAVWVAGGSNTWNYKTTNVASRYEQNGIAGAGTHAWYIAPSGTAGNAITFTQAMTLTAAGSLQVVTSGYPSLSLSNILLNSASTSGTTGLYMGDAASGVNMLTREKVTINTAYARIYAEQGYNVASLCASFYNTAAYQGNNSTAWATPSDERVKTNIRPIGNALEKICALNAVHFEYKNALGKIKTSFIAQEFEEVLPGHVHEVPAPDDLKEFVGEDGMMKALDPELIPYLVAAIKELSAQVTALQTQVTALKG